jgi:cyclophilin family peptidyl-prolyl cis-trans isomerase
MVPVVRVASHRRLSRRVVLGTALAVVLSSAIGLQAFTGAQAKTTWWNPISWFETPTASTPESPVATSAVAQPVVPATTKPSRAIAEAAEKPSAEAILPPGYGAVMETERGRVVIELYPKEAPITVANFIKLVDARFYNVRSMTFHRVEPGFVVQTGDPTATGAGGSGKQIPLEVQNKLSHDDMGVVAMARTAAPNSATSQFYITLAPARFLDGKYAVFGHVIQGLDVLPKIERGDRVYGIRMEDIREAKAQAELDAKANGSLGKKLKKWL